MKTLEKLKQEMDDAEAAWDAIADDAIDISRFGADI